MRTIWMAMALLFLPAAAGAQDSSNASVLAVVDGFLGALNARDPAAMAPLVLEAGQITAFIERDGEDRLRARSFADDMATLGSEQSKLNETYWEPVVLVEGNIAVVWARYSFDRDDTRSHCGIDVFNLLRVDGRWKIANLIYTVVPDGCPAGR